MNSPTTKKRFRDDDDKDSNNIVLTNPTTTTSSSSSPTRKSSRMKIIHGDLLTLAIQGKFDVIIHGCNCKCTMGKGIAAQIKKIFPEAYEADLQTKPLGVQKLGTISYAHITKTQNIKHDLIVVNAYTQNNWTGPGPNGDGVLAEYDAIRKGFRTIKQLFHGKKIGYPKIGAGLANGDWNIISQIILEELQGEDHWLVVRD
jgi:O-acetyl-ADP-ribose deacetylase (regulator of RNase III)